MFKLIVNIILCIALAYSTLGYLISKDLEGVVAYGLDVLMILALLNINN